jgi:hypothetical protein
MSTFNPAPTMLFQHNDDPHVGTSTHAYVPATNGRIAIDDRKVRKNYRLFKPSETVPERSTHLDSIQTSTDLSTAYFSNANQTILQNAIRHNVHKQTGEVIGNQDAIQLQIIMRSIFLQYARHNDGVPVCEQIASLNSRVLDYALPHVVSNVRQYLQYKKDASTLPEPFEHAINVSQKGSKTLSEHPFV